MNNLCSGLMLVAVLCAGCGPQVKPQPFDPLGAVEPSAQDKIKNALEKAGVTKEVAAIVEMDDAWMVTLRTPQDPKAADGQAERGIPEKATVNKSTFEVKVLNPGGLGGRQAPPN